MTNKIAPVNPGLGVDMAIDTEAEKVREAVPIEVEAIEFRELTAADLTLAIRRQELGVLETNVEQIKEAVLAALPGYTPENYQGRIDALKKDKAALNNAAEELNSARLRLEREFMKPFEVVKGTISETVNAIKNASGKLAEVANELDAQEKNNKQAWIGEYWRIKEFPFPGVYAKIFDPKWLNKTVTKKVISAELDAKCEKIMADIKILERFPVEDQDELKAFYLDTLDISKTFERADRLKENREAVEKEAVEREEREKKVAMQKQLRDDANAFFEEQRNAPIRAMATAALGDIATTEKEQGDSLPAESIDSEKAERPEREVTEQVNAQAAELYHEEVAEQKAEPVRSLASAALGETIPDPATERVTYVMEFTGTRAALFALREYMNENRIIYKVIEKTA